MNASDSSRAQDGVAQLWLRKEEADAGAILQRLLTEASQQVPGLSADPTLTDPLARLLLSAIAREYARLYGKLGQVVDLAYERLVQSLLAFPRAPVPSSTVLQLRVKDPGTRVGGSLRVVGRKAIAVEGRQEERAVHFAPLEKVTIPRVGGPAVLLQTAAGEVQLLASGDEPIGTASKPLPPWRATASEHPYVHLGVDLPPELGDEPVPLFLSCDDRLAQTLIWSVWEAGASEQPRTLVPGDTHRLQPWQANAEVHLWRMRSDRSRPPSPWDRNFVQLPVALVRAGQGLPHPAVKAGVDSGALPSVPTRCWVRVRVGRGAPEPALRALRVLANCVVAFNQEAQSARFAVGPEPVHVLDLPLTYRELFRIDEIVDSANTLHYLDGETAEGLAATDRYHLDRAPDGQVRLRLRAATRAPRPRRIEIYYTTTQATSADGMAPGGAAVIFDPSLVPGVEQAVNVSPSKGGGDAAEEAHHIEELRALLATRARAVTARDFEKLALAFDPGRIHRVRIGRGVARTDTGLGSCVLVRAWCSAGTFASELEREAFQEALQRDLQTRAPAGQIVVADLREDGADAADDA